MSPSTVSRSRSRGLALALVGTMSLAGLAGCSVGLEETETPTIEDSAPTTETPQEEPADAAPTTDGTTEEEPTEEEPTQEEPTTEEPADDTGTGQASGEVPEPGTEFAIGDTVTTHVQALQEGDEYYGYATLATTVTAAEQADPSLFTEAENAADFAGYVPWFVTVDHEWLTYEGTPNSNMIPTLVAFNSSGGELSSVRNATWTAGIPGCEIEMPDEKKAGETASNCHVFAVPEGEEIGSVGWRGDDYADGGGSAMDNPYYDEPVIWTVG